MKVTMVGNGTAVHIYTEYTATEFTAADGTVVPEHVFRNTECGAIEGSGNAIYLDRRIKSLSAIWEAPLEEVTCKRCLRGWNSDAAREARENQAERDRMAAARAAAPDAAVDPADSTIVLDADTFKALTSGTIPARDSIYALNMAAVDGRTVTQGHADYCAAHGHATWHVDGVDQLHCARCGEPHKGDTATARREAAAAPYVPRNGDEVTHVERQLRGVVLDGHVRKSGPRKGQVEVMWIGGRWQDTAFPAELRPVKRV